jgi:DNA-binding CsgD family transcriptional regulator
MLLDCLMILDENLDVVALDAGAEALLSGSGSGRSLQLPREILDLLNSPQSDPEEGYLPLKIGNYEYSYRLMQIRQPSDSPSKPMRALYLWQETSAVDAVLQAAAEYHLTDREKEALIGVTMGLTSKEVAMRMDISPNTVKAFLRLIMIKMGVPTRAGIVGRLLDQNSGARKIRVQGG